MVMEAEAIDCAHIVYYIVDRSSKPGGRSPCAGGKSELRRAGCWVTPRRGDPTESATETYRQRPISIGAGKVEMVR